MTGAEASAFRRSDLPPPRLGPVFAALAGLPLLLVVCVGGTAAALAATRGLSGDALQTAVQGLLPLPAVLAFAGSVALTLTLAKRQGLDVSALGLGRPAPGDLALGVVVAAVVVAADLRWAFPWLATAQPTFDPTMGAVPPWAAVPMLAFGVFAEDLVFRGFALWGLSRRWGVAPAVVVTSAAYALLAPGPEWPLKAWTFSLGVLLAGLTLWRGQLWPALLVHLAAVTAGPLSR